MQTNYLQSKFRKWIGAIFFLLIFARVAFYTGHKAYLGYKLDPFDLVLIPIGVVALFLSYMYFKKIFGQEDTQ